MFLTVQIITYAIGAVQMPHLILHNQPIVQHP